MSTERVYKDYGDLAEHLWKLCGRFVDRTGVIDLEERTFLRFVSRDGRERCVICGPNAITTNAALDGAGVEHHKWIRLGSIAVLFDWCHLEAVRSYLVKIFGEEPKLFALDCARSSVASALRAYRRRRDAMLMEAGA